MAAGIVNPFAGQHLRPIWHADTALVDLEATLDLAGASRHYSKSGVLRPASSAAQAELFRTAASSNTWLTSEDVKEQYPWLNADFGALHTPGGQVDTSQFLLDTQQKLQERGGTVRRNAHVTGWTESTRQGSITLQSGVRHSASLIVLAVGYGYLRFPALNRLNLHSVKGQTVEVSHLPGLKLALPVCGQGYVAPGTKSLTLGTTYERDFDDLTPTRSGQRAIIKLTSSMIPRLANAGVTGAAAGVRVGVPGTRLPMVGPIGRRVWIFTGLGSKGLLFAPHIARRLPAWLENPEHVPPEIRVRLRQTTGP